MECLLEAHPIPDITWYHGDEKLKENSKRFKMIRKSISKNVYALSLEIKDPCNEDGGAYRCNAVNCYGESNANISLNFQGNNCNNQSSKIKCNKIPKKHIVSVLLNFSTLNYVYNRCRSISKLIDFKMYNSF